jgi:glycosyltransferase involved in cell wall biosynthesis
VKVLYIATAFPRFEGDIITPWLVEVIKRLRAKGVDARVFTSSYKGLRSQQIYGIQVYRFRYFFKKWESLTHEETAVDRVKKGFLNKLLVLPYMLCGTISIAIHCMRNKYDIIHTHWPLPHAVFGYVASKASRAKHILYFHGVELMWVRKELPILKPFLRWAIKSADAVMCNSTHTANRIKEIYNREIHVIPSGQSAKPDKDPTVFTIKSKTSNEKSILYVGRLVERKGVKYLIQAYAKIRNEIDARVSIVSTGPEMEALRKLAEELRVNDKIDFLGQITPQELDQCYQNADVFVLPAVIDAKGDTEGLGVVLIEALTYKLPVIATGIGGIVDIIKDNETGILVPEKDADALARALLKVLKDDKYAKMLGEKGYQFVNEKYNWKTITDQIINLFTKTLSLK